MTHSDRNLCEKLRLFAHNRLHSVQKVTQRKFDRIRTTLSVAPFSTYDLGIKWEARELYYVRYDQWPEIIHELAHLMACQHVPNRAPEWDFFGWEIAMVHHIGGSLDKWLESNRHYGVDNHRDLGNLPPIDLHRLLAERLEVAATTGLVIDGVPQAVR